MEPIQWNVIAVTAPQRALCDAYVSELYALQTTGKLHKETVLLSVPDSLEGNSIGSGGATLNAIVVVTEHLSARKGYTSINPSTLTDQRVLIVNVATVCRRVPYMVGLPLESSDGTPVGQLEFLLSTLSIGKAGRAKPGVWVCSTDTVFLDFVPKLDSVKQGITVLSTSLNTEINHQHGSYEIERHSKKVLKLNYPHSTVDKPQFENRILQLVCGLVYFDLPATAELINLASFPPFDCSTYIGIDDGGVPKKLSLFLDLIVALLPDTSENDYLRKTQYLSRLEREHVWNALHKKFPVHSMKTVSSQANGDCSFLFLHRPREYRILHTEPTKNFVHFAASMNYNCTTHIHSNNIKSQGNAACIINSILSENVEVGPGSLIENCRILEKWIIGENVICSGVRHLSWCPLSVPCSYIVQEIVISPDSFVVLFYHMDDDKYGDKFCGIKFEKLLKSCGLQAADLWEGEEQVFATAKLFPIVNNDNPKKFMSLYKLASLLFQFTETENCYLDSEFEASILEWKNEDRMSLVEISNMLDITSETSWRRELGFKVDCTKIVHVLRSKQDINLRPLYRKMAQVSYWDILDTLDEFVIEEDNTFDIVARSLAHMGDILALFAADRGGLRSGPSNNREFQPALMKLEGGHIQQGIEMLRRVRTKWITVGYASRSAPPYALPECLIRVARHYEGAAAVMTRRATLTCGKYVERLSTTMPSLNHWICVTCPVRIDLAGGWTDTPPICFECGGVVTNIAIEIDGKRPLGCLARRIPRSVVIFRIRGYLEIEYSDLSDLEDFCRPSAPAALLKAALLCTKLISLSSKYSLQVQLLDRFGSGLEIESFSNLPMGSGLGTSSILASCILAAIAKTAGFQYDNESLVHEVLIVEQMLTTGGGWQDQAGGIWPGAKMTISEARLPLKVTTRSLILSEEFVRKLNKHLLLLFTGKARLARNLLQNVVRRWFARLPEIMNTIMELKRNAKDAAEAIEEENIKQVGSCLRKYWSHKKQMADGCEPDFVGVIFDILRKENLVYGESLCGAGGGGFMVLITTEPDAKLLVQQALKKCLDISDLQFHNARVDRRGIVISDVETEKINLSNLQ